MSRFSFRTLTNSPVDQRLFDIARKEDVIIRQQAVQIGLLRQLINNNVGASSTSLSIAITSHSAFNIKPISGASNEKKYDIKVQNMTTNVITPCPMGKSVNLTYKTNLIFNTNYFVKGTKYQVRAEPLFEGGTTLVSGVTLFN